MHDISPNKEAERSLIKSVYAQQNRDSYFKKNNSCFKQDIA